MDDLCDQRARSPVLQGVRAPPRSARRTREAAPSISCVSRTTIIVFIAVGATLAGFAIASNADRLRGDTSSPETSVPAAPQTAELNWRETYGDPGQQLVFTVRSLEVTETGWNAEIGIDNETTVAWELAPGAVADGTFGISLFETGDAHELDRRNRSRTLPAVRGATTFVPELAKILEPKASWEGQISARGALVAGAWARVVFGTLVAVGKPPEGMDVLVVWITDSAYELRA